MTDRYVLDSSVVIKWFSQTDDPDIEKALKLRYDHMEERCILTAPSLMLCEVANVLRFKPGFDEEKVKTALESLSLMHIDILPIDPDLCAEAVEIAYKKELTVYDSYFIALAHKLDCKLITADEKLYERASDIPWVISLSEL